MNPTGPEPDPPDGDHPSAPDHEDGRPGPAADNVARRRRAAVVAGHTGDLAAAGDLADDPDPLVRAAALGALVRAGGLDESRRAAAAADRDPRVRRRLAEELGRHQPWEATESVTNLLIGLLGDADPLTAEAAAWALGEVVSGGEPPDAAPAATSVASGQPLRADALAALIEATSHDDPLVREAAVAALGAVGDLAGLDAVLAGTTDRPAIRRRAVLALAAFLGEPGVDDALARAMDDRDWQVRQAADLLRRPDP